MFYQYETVRLNFNLSKIIEKYLKEDIIDAEYFGFDLDDLNNLKGAKYFLSKDWKGQKHCKWRRTIFYQKPEDIEYWITYLNNRIDKMVVGSDDKFGLELLSKLKTCTGYYAEPNRGSCNIVSLDADYEYTFDEAKTALDFRFSIETWRLEQDSKDDFSINAYCRYHFEDRSYEDICFQVLIISYEKLTRLSKIWTNEQQPLVYILSNHTDRKELEYYIHDTFKNIKGNSREEVKLKLATFTPDLDVIDLLSKPFCSGEPYRLILSESKKQSPINNID